MILARKYKKNNFKVEIFQKIKKDRKVELFDPSSYLSQKYKITKIPKTIRYQPKTLKVCFLIYCIKNLIAMIEVMKAVTNPTARIKASSGVKTSPNLTSLKRAAPNITGIAKKNVNSVATVRETPKSKAPTIVAPERDVPGKIAAINWKKPIKITV